MKDDKMTIYSVRYSEFGVDVPLVRWFDTEEKANAFYDSKKEFVDAPVKHNFDRQRALLLLEMSR